MPNAIPPSLTVPAEPYDFGFDIATTALSSSTCSATSSSPAASASCSATT